jgi:rRNA maturation RNase YbeY
MSGKPKAGVEGEIYISVDRVRDNAVGLAIPYYDELLRVMLHGALHLCGYKDKTPPEQKRMRRMEDKYLKLFKDRLG